MANTDNHMQPLELAKRKKDPSNSTQKEDFPIKVAKKVQEATTENFKENIVGNKEKEKIDLKGKGIVQDEIDKGKKIVEEVDHDVDAIDYRDYGFDYDFGDHNDDTDDDESDETDELWSLDSDGEYFYGEKGMDGTIQSGGGARVEKGIVIANDPKDRCKNDSDNESLALADKKGKKVIE